MANDQTSEPDGVPQFQTAIPHDVPRVDIAQASGRIEEHRWSNVELIPRDVARHIFPSALGGILSTFALTLVPEFDNVVRNGAEALAPKKRFVILNFK